MKIYNHWNLDLGIDSLFYTKEETTDNVKSNFDIRRFYGAEGKNVIIDNNHNEKVLIQRHTNPLNEYRIDRKMLTYVNAEVYRGSYVQYENKVWLIISTVNNIDDAYKSMQIQQCNYTLPFQTTTSTILNEPCIVAQNKFSGTGEKEDKIITLPDTQRLIYIQYNDNTKYLTEEKRIFIDNNTDKPKVYHISKVDRICFMDGEHGLLELTCVEDSFNPKTDNRELKIADYIDKENTTPDALSETEDITDNGICLITNTRDVIYKDIELKVGGTKKPFVCKFKDKNSNVIDKIPKWELIINDNDLIDKVHLTYNQEYPNRCYINIDWDTSLIGTSFKLKLLDSLDELKPFELLCRVVSF